MIMIMVKTIQYQKDETCRDSKKNSPLLALFTTNTKQSQEKCTLASQKEPLFIVFKGILGLFPAEIASPGPSLGN